MVVDVQALPDKIKRSPHWRVNFQPSIYKERIKSTEAFDIIKGTSLSLRGWSYPYS